MRVRLTPRGVGFLVAGLATVVLASVAGQADLVWPGLFVAALTPLSLLATVALRPRFRIERRLVPPVVAVGESVRIELESTSLSHLASGAVVATDVLPPAVGADHRFALASARRGQLTETSYVREPRRRGRHPLGGVRHEVTDPLGLAMRRSRTPTASVLVVTPAVVPLAPSHTQAFGRHGETPIPQTALAGPDDVLVREYQPRDDVRRIHWPSTARHGQLMVRREEQAWDPTAWVILDSRRTVAGRFEWLVSAAASVGVRLLDEGYEVSLTDATGDAHTTSARGGAAARAAWLDRLVDATLTDESTLGPAARAVEQAPSGHLVVALLGDLDVEDAHRLADMHDARQECRAIWTTATDRPEAADAVAVLLDHGWRVATCPAGGDLAAAWASLLPVGSDR